jgi:hypothetical protein
MALTRRQFTRAGTAAAMAAVLPAPARGADLVQVRRSVGSLAREKSALLESYRRAVDVMMQRDVTDKTSWWFQANIYGAAKADIAGPLKPLAKYWRQCPRRTYFFLSWQRMHLYFFERILRRACGDPVFALPYWGYDDPEQAPLPAAFRPDDNEREAPSSARGNALARAKRSAGVESGTVGLDGIARDIKALLSLDRFAADGVLDARGSFGGVRVADAKSRVAAGGIEALCNRIHLMLGRDGDLGSAASAARDPVFWLHAANIDRLWVKWTDPVRGRVPPVGDDVWMKAAFTFVDENGDDRTMTGGEVLDTQHQLGYRYDDDPPRPARLAMDAQPGKGAPREEIVLARGQGIELAAQDSHLVMAPVARPRPKPAPKAKQKAKAPPRAPRLYVVLRDIAAPDRALPYDVSLVLEGPNVFDATATAVPIGRLELFGDAGRQGSTGEAVAFDVTDAIAKLSRVRGYNIRHLRVSIARRALADGSGKHVVPADPNPPQIGAIELVQG